MVILSFQNDQTHTHMVGEHEFSSQVVNLVGVTLRVEYGGDRVGILSLVVHAGDFDWAWFMLNLTRKGVVRGTVKQPRMEGGMDLCQFVGQLLFICGIVVYLAGVSHTYLYYLMLILMSV